MPCLLRIRNRATERAEGLNLPSLTNWLTTSVMRTLSCPRIWRRNPIRSRASGSSATSSLTIGLSSLLNMGSCGSGTTSCPTNSSSKRRVCLITAPVTRWTLPLRVVRSFTLIVISSPETIPAKKSPGISMQTPGAENDFFAFYCCLVVWLFCWSLKNHLPFFVCHHHAVCAKIRLFVVFCNSCVKINVLIVEH